MADGSSVSTCALRECACVCAGKHLSERDSEIVPIAANKQFAGRARVQDDRLPVDVGVNPSIEKLDYAGLLMVDIISKPSAGPKYFLECTPENI